MSDVRPSLETRLSSRLSRSTSADRLLQRAARHAGGASLLTRLAERREQSVSRREGVGTSLLGMLVSRLADRGAYRSTQPIFGAWGGTEEVVTALPPWLSRQAAAEAPVPEVRRSPWIGAYSAWSPAIVAVPSSATLARSARTMGGFSRGEARRSALAAPSLATAEVARRSFRSADSASVTAPGYGRSFESPVGALGFSTSSVGGSSVARQSSRSARPTSAVARAAAMFPEGGAVVARQSGRGAYAGALVAPRASRNAVARSEGNLGAARAAVAREFSVAAPVAAPGRALARATEARPSGRGFAVARSAGRGYAAADLALAQAPIARATESQPTQKAVDGFARRAASGPTSSAVTATWGALSRSARQDVTTVRALARSTAVTAAATRPLARAVDAAAAPAIGEPGARGFAPLTRRATAQRYVGAPTAAWNVGGGPGAATASPSYGAFEGASMGLSRAALGVAARAATASYGAFTGAAVARARELTSRPAPVARALDRQEGGATRVGREAVSGIPRMAATLSTAALTLAAAPSFSTESDSGAEAGSRPLTRAADSRSSGWIVPRSAAVTAGPLSRQATSQATTAARAAGVARQGARPLTRALAARSASTAVTASAVSSDWSGAPTAGSPAAGALSRAVSAGAAPSIGTSTMEPTRGLRRSARTPTAVARAAGFAPAALSSAPVARSARSDRFEAPQGAVSRSFARSMPAAPATMRRFAPASPAMDVALAPTASRSLDATATAPVTSTIVRDGWTGAPVAASGTALARSTARTGAARSSTASPAARALARYSDFTGAPVAGAAAASTASTASLARAHRQARSAPSAGLSRQLQRDAVVSPVSAGTRTVARSMTTAAALGLPASVRRSNLPSIDGTVATAPIARRSAAPDAPAIQGFASPASAATTAVARAQSGSSTARTAAAQRAADASRARVARASSSEFIGAPVARAQRGEFSPATVARATSGAYEGAPVARSSAAPRSPAARALARASMSVGSSAVFADGQATPGVIRRAERRMDAPVARAEGRTRPLTTSRSFDGTLPSLPSVAHSYGTESTETVAGFAASRSTAPGQSLSRSSSTPWITGLPGSTAVTAARSASSAGSSAVTAAALRSAQGEGSRTWRSASHGGAPSQVSRAVARASASSTGTSAGLGFQSGRASVARAQRAGLPAPALPVATAPLARAASPAPGGSAAFGSATWSPWIGATSADPLHRSAGSSAQTALARAERAGGAARTAGALARHAGSTALTADLPRRAARSAAVTAGSDLALARSTSRTTEWTSSPTPGAALARAVSRGAESSALTASSPLRRQIELPAAIARRDSSSTPTHESAVRRRADRRADPYIGAPVSRAHGGGGFGGDILARIARVQGAASTASRSARGEFETTTADAGGLVRRAAGRMVNRREVAAQRRAASALPAASAIVSRQQTETVSPSEIARMIQRQVADLTHIQAAAPTVSRSASAPIKRTAAEANGRGADRDVGKKPDLDDFLRRAVRRIIIEEEVLQSRELSLMD